MAAAANAAQTPYSIASGLSWTQDPMSRAHKDPVAGPSTYSPQSYTDRGSVAGTSYHYDGRSSDAGNTSFLPDVRVVSPSIAGGEEWDDDKSVYSQRTSTATQQYYYSEVFQSGSRDSNKLSIYSSSSTSGSGLSSDVYRDSWQTNGGARPDSNLDPFAFRHYETPRAQLPKVVVSSPSEASFRHRSIGERERSRTPSPTLEETEGKAVVPTAVASVSSSQVQGRVPSVVQGARNFSRPNRPPIMSSGSDDERKRVIVERNQHRHGSPQASAPATPVTQPHTPLSRVVSTSTRGHGSVESRASEEDVYGGMMSDSAESGDDHQRSTSHLADLPLHNHLDHNQPRTPSPSQRSPLSVPPPSLSHSSSLSSTQSGHLPRTPQALMLPSSPDRPESVYSNYSYYQLDPSPSSSSFPSQKDLRASESGKTVGLASPTQAQTLYRPPSKSKSPVSSPGPGGAPPSPKTAGDFLTLGIAHHEADRLPESARCFEQSATLNGGCAVGMLMWGLALRHGWGVPKDEQRAFKWLKRAAEHAVVDLQAGGGNVEKDAVKVSVYSFLALLK